MTGEIGGEFGFRILASYGLVNPERLKKKGWRVLKEDKAGQSYGIGSDRDMFMVTARPDRFAITDRWPDPNDKGQIRVAEISKKQTGIEVKYYTESRQDTTFEIHYDSYGAYQESFFQENGQVFRPKEERFEEARRNWGVLPELVYPINLGDPQSVVSIDFYDVVLNTIPEAEKTNGKGPFQSKWLKMLGE